MTWRRKAFACVGAAVTAVLFITAGMGASVAAMGKPAPAFMVDALDGGTITADFHGQPAYINVFATWCPPCRGEIPLIVRAAKQYRGRVAVVFVDEQESPQRVQSFAREFGIASPVAIDQGQFAATYGLGSIPLSVFIDRHGIVRFIYRGPIPKRVLEHDLSILASS
jgi:cytochrome c biogenesis protein CcmG, thiol:disulfide interchange protein DsbE